MEEDDESGDFDGVKDASSGEEDDNNGLEVEGDHDKLEEDEDNEPEEPRVRKRESHETEPKDGAEPEDKGKTSAIKKCSSVKSNKSPSKPVSKKATQQVEDEPVVVDSKHDSTKKQTKKGSMATTKEKATPVKKEDKNKSSKKNASVNATDSGPSKFPNSRKEDGKKGQNKEKITVEDKKARKKKEAKPVTNVAKEQGITLHLQLSETFFYVLSGFSLLFAKLFCP